jgi:hypothetical protein
MGGAVELSMWGGYDPAKVEATCQERCWVLGP